MALELTTLDPSTLPPSVQRLVGPGAPAPMQQMAARGMAPLPPRELALALYQLAQPWASEETAGAIGLDARKTAADLPEGLLQSALGGDLDVRVIDFFAHRIAHRGKVLQVVLLNKATADETFASLARFVGESEATMIARNEERLLRHPAIIAGLYLNKRTPMSTATRAIELAIRHGLTVDGVPHFGELKAVIEGGQAKAASQIEDATFQQVADEQGLIDDLLGNPDAVVLDDEAQAAKEHAATLPGDTEKKVQNIGALSVPAKIRLATLGNEFARSVLVRDPSRMVAVAAVSSPQVTDNEVVKYSGNRGLSEDVIRYIAKQRHFTRLHAVKMNLVGNPKTPVSTAIGYLGSMSVKELRNISRSKSISSAVVKAAQAILLTKQK